VGSNTNSSNIGGGVLVTHFWKLFAVVVLALVTWAAYGNRRTWNSFRVTTETSGTPFQPVTSFIYHGFLSDRFTEQVKPAEVRLKGTGGTVDGFFYSADQEFVMLETIHPDKAEIETVLIPWENVLYVRMSRKERRDQNK
jgi:hypothetical protein